MTTEAEYTVVYPGNDFPKGALRAMGRGLACSDPDACDSFVALWIRDDGESVFGRAFNKYGKAEAYFPWAGKAVHSSETRGFRVLTYIGPHKDHTYRYKWVRAGKADPSTVMLVGGYCAAVVQCTDGTECLGKASVDRKTAWSVDSSSKTEVCHQGDEYRNAFLLCKFPVKD